MMTAYEDSYTTRRFQFDVGGLQRYALEHGLTAILYIILAAGDKRAVALINHTERSILAEVIGADLCRFLFGHDEPGIYEIIVRRSFEDPGVPTEEDLSP